MNTPKQNKMIHQVTAQYDILRELVISLLQAELTSGILPAIDMSEADLKQSLLDEEDLR